LARGVRVIQTDTGGTVEHDAAQGADMIPIGAGPPCARKPRRIWRAGSCRRTPCRSCLSTIRRRRSWRWSAPC